MRATRAEGEKQIFHFTFFIYGGFEEALSMKLPAA
jgi:hypothetical protein